MVEKTAFLNYVFIEALAWIITSNMVCIVLKVPAVKRIYIWTLILLKLGLVNVVCFRMGFVTGRWQIVFLCELSAIVFIGLNMIILEMPLLEVATAVILIELECLGTVVLPMTIMNALFYGKEGLEGRAPLGWQSVLGAAVVLVLNYWVGKFLYEHHINLVDHKLRFRGFWAVITIGYLFYSSIGMGPTGTDFKLTVGQLIPSIIAVIVLYEVSWFVRRNTEKRIQKENESLVIENTVMKEYYTSLDDQIQRTRKLNHDIQNHMTVLRELYEKEHWDDNGKEYIEELEMEFQKSIPTIFCDDPVINAVLTNKRKMCLTNNIPIHIEMKAFQMGNIKEMDMVALFVNLMDNAIEECLRMPKEKRKIEVLCEQREANEFLLIRNSTEKADTPKADFTDETMWKKILKTSKKDAAAHGVGLQIVRDIIDRQEGNLEMSVQDGMFETLIQWII